MMKEAKPQLGRYQALMKNALDGIHIMDTQGNVIEVNDSFCDMLGYTREEANTLNMADWDVQWSKAELPARLQDLLDKSARFETVHRCKDGTLINVEVSATGIEIEGRVLFFASSRDITQRKKSESLMRYHTQVVSNTHEGFWGVDEKGNLLEVNQAYANMSGYTVDELLQMHISQLDALEDDRMMQARIKKILVEGHDLFETRHRHKDGHLFDLEVSVGYMPELQQFFAFFRDISVRKRIEHESKVLVLMQQALMNSALEGIHIMDIQGNVVEANNTFCQMLGYTQEEVRKLNVTDWDAQWSREELMSRFSALVLLKDTRFETRHRRKDGVLIEVEISTTGAEIDGKQYLFASSHDISYRKAAEEKIRQLAFHDPLTRLPNRQLLLDRMQHALSSSARGERNCAVLFIDLDNFKTLNDTLGHAMGDLLLQQVAGRLVACVREGDTVARLGGDEFVVILESLSEHMLEASEQAEAVGEKILAALSEPYQLNAHAFRSSGSIGATVFNGEQNAEELLKHADIAMYQAKKAGRNTLRFFDHRMQDVINARASLEDEMRNALEGRQFQLYYQIQVDNRRRPSGAEALVRWNHPVRGLMPPVQFIPLAEETGLILPMGLWVLESACAQLKAWEDDERTRHLVLAVNISAMQFHQADFVAQVKAVVADNAINPALLKLELTESMLLDNTEDTVATMNALKVIGVQLSLDDFGTGYSSLQYLKLLPFNQIKIDQSFVRDIATDHNDAVIVQTIIAMSEALGLDVIAEGVETEVQHEFLDLRGCHSYQGYLFGKPMPIEQFEALLSSPDKA